MLLCRLRRWFSASEIAGTMSSLIEQERRNHQWPLGQGTFCKEFSEDTWKTFSLSPRQVFTRLEDTVSFNTSEKATNNSVIGS